MELPIPQLHLLHNGFMNDLCTTHDSTYTYVYSHMMCGPIRPSFRNPLAPITQTGPHSNQETATCLYETDALDRYMQGRIDRPAEGGERACNSCTSCIESEMLVVINLNHYLTHYNITHNYTVS